MRAAGQETRQSTSGSFGVRLRHSELEYPSWWTTERVLGWLRALPEHTTWNSCICIAVLVAITWVVIDFTNSPAEGTIMVVDVVYNVVYGVHVVAMGYDVLVVMQQVKVHWYTLFGFLLDFVSYLHYAIVVGNYRAFKLACYYLRLHRPFKYLWALNDYNLKGSILGTTLKYIYIFFVLRVTWALIWVHIDKLETAWDQMNMRRALYEVQLEQDQATSTDWSSWYWNSSASQFLNAIYIVNKMFIPIGPSVAPSNDIERVACLLVMLTGCLVVTGAAVASLSLVISIYMRPEEAFRARYRLIMKIMKESNIPPSLREKVETFYRMYWLKQKAVSATQLLPTYPPTLPATIYTDIYFEATQKSRVLCDLSYQFLSEVAKKMNTIHYIPGDTIIKRTSRKSSMIFIAYGDIEMLSAEDDSTAVVRMTRGTSVAGCAGSAPAACARAHTAIRAATFCIAHALHAPDLWRVALKYGRDTDQTQILLGAFYEHLERVKRHYYQKIPEEVKYKSSILHFKRNLLSLMEARDADGRLLLDRPDVFLEIAGCYIMRNRADGSQTDDADAICLRSTFPCILQPSSSLQVAWNAFMCCLILIVCFTHPYFLVFRETVPLEFRFFDYVVTVLYIVDLVVHLSTGNNVEEGVPITFGQTASQQMRSQWFVMAVGGMLPIFEFIGDGHFAGINKLLRVPKLFRMLKSMEEVCVYHSNVVRFMSYTLLLIVACYLIAALQQGFMCFQFGYCLVTNFTHPPYWENSSLDVETVEHRLTFSLYWAISMITFTTHMESWGITKWDSALYALFVLEMCVVLHIFIESVYSATIMVTTALREDYDSCIEHVKDFLIRNDVDPLLRKRFITYLQLCWYTDKAYSMTNKKSSIFHDLPPHVYQDIVSRQRSKYLLSIPFIKLLNKEDLKDVSSKAKLFYTSPNEILLNTGDISNEMYLIKQGICEMVHPETKEVIGSLGVKNHFGVLECLLRIPAYYTVRAVTHVQVFSISKKVLAKAVEMPQVRDAIEFAKEQPEYGRLCVHRPSFLRYRLPAPTPNTERFRLPRKHEEDYAFLHPFYRLGFFSILRYIFPRFSIRPDGKYILRYECFRAACALLSATVFPCYTYLELQWPWLYFLTFLLDFAAFFDIIQRMLVGYYNEQGVLVYHPVSTAAHYLKGAFVADVFAWLPLEYLQSPHKETFEKYYRLTQSRQVLMLNRLLQLYRLPGAMYNLGGYIDRRDIVLVLKAIPLFMALLNALTCFMVFNSVNIYATTSGEWLIVPLADDGGSWINLFNDTFRFNLTETPWNLHLATYFWVVYETTTTGYNSFNPSNFQLMEILFLGMVIGAMITTYFSVRIISIRANVNKELAAYQEDMKDIAAFMRRENLDKDLQKDVTDYYEHSWDKMGGVDYANVLKLCDQITLRTDATLHLYGTTFEQCPFLSNCDISLLRIIGRAVRNMYFLRGMSLIERDDVISNMYFVDYGTVNVRITTAEVSTIVKLHRGSVFGNLGNVATLRCPVSIVATSRVHLLQINAVAFHLVIADFPQVAQSLQQHRPNNESFIEGIQVGHKDRLLSTAQMLPARRGLIRYLYFKDKVVQIYLIIVALACVYADLYNAGFQDNSMLLIIVLYGLDIGFYLKILIQYSLPHIVSTNHLKELLLPVRRQYFRNDFKYDLMSCLPLELLSLAYGKHQWMAFSLLRLNRMLRIVTVYKCLKRHSSRITVNLTLSTVFSVFVWFTLFVHTVACLWYFISFVEDRSSPLSSWRHKDDGSTWCQGVYVCSVYFVLTTFTQNGVGDIMPKNHAEVVFVSLLQIISTLVYMVYVGEFSNIIQFQSFRSFSFYSKYLELQEYLKNNRVSKNLVNMVNRYTLHLWRESRGLQVPHFLKAAPQCLRLQIMSAAYIQHLDENPIFEDCEPAFLRQLVGCLQPYTYNEGMYVVKESEITDAMYFIHAGRVLETSAALGDGRTFLPGECFGVEHGLLYDIPFASSYRTLVRSQVLTLQLIKWEYLMEHFPKSRATIYKNVRRDGDYPPRSPQVRIQMQSMDGRWSDFLSPIPETMRPRHLSSQGRPPTEHRRSRPSGQRHSGQKPSGHGPSGPGQGPPPSPSPPPSPPPPPPPTVLSSPPEVPGNYGFFPVDRSSPELSSPSAILLSELEPTLVNQATSSPQLTTTATATSTERIRVQADAQSQVADLKSIKSSLDARFETMLENISPEDALPAPVTETSQPLLNTKEPIVVTQPYSSHSLKIIELPPSVTKVKSVTEASKIDSKQKAVPSSSSAQITGVSAPSTSRFDESAEAQREPLTELDLEFVDADIASVNYPFLWPLDSRKSGAVPEVPEEDDQQTEVERIKSIRSIQSQMSLEQETRVRGPRDVEDALKSSMTLLDKMESRAKKLFRKKTSSEAVMGNEELSDKDILLIEEDEAATSALLHKIKKQDRAREIQKIRGSRSDTTVPSSETLKHSQEALDQKRQKASAVRIHEPSLEELALIPYDRRLAESSRQFDVSGIKEEPTSTSRMKRSVRYKEDPRETAGGPPERSVDNEERDSVQSTRSEVLSVRSLQIKDHGSTSSVHFSIPKDKRDKSSSEEETVKTVKGDEKEKEDRKKEQDKKEK